MAGVVDRVIVIATFLGVAGASFAAHAQQKPALTGYVMATWNIAKLATDGRALFGGRVTRQATDYENLRRVRDSIAADIYALQEISSPAALARVFDTTTFELCFSGQWRADALGLEPNYSAAKMKKHGVAPKCFAPDEATPDTVGDDSRLKQYVAVAVRRSSGIRVAQKEDASTLSTMTLDHPRGAAENDAELRTLRFGLDVTLQRGDAELRLLVVHLKSGCPDRAIPAAPTPFPAIAGQLPEDACEVVSRQIPELKTWIDAASRSGGPSFVIAGDFNRRFSQELQNRPPLRPSEQYWPRLLGQRSPSTADDVTLEIYPRTKGDVCFVWDHADSGHPIDYFVYGGGPTPAGASVRKLRFHDVRDGAGNPLAPSDPNAPGTPKWPGGGASDAEKDAFYAAVANWTDRLSDHCPRILTAP